MKTKLLRTLLAVFIVVLCAGCLNTFGTSDSEYDDRGISITDMYPGGNCGLFRDGEAVEVIFHGLNTSGRKQTITITCVVTDYYGRQIGAPHAQIIAVEPSLERGFTQAVNLGSFGNARGWFCIRATVAQGPLVLCRLATGCCVLEATKCSSSFVSANCNGAFDALLMSALPRIGIQNRGKIFKLGYADKDWRTDDSIGILLRDDPFWNSTWDITGYILTDKYGNGWPSWHPLAEYPYSEDYYKEFGDFVRAVARACGKRIKTWVLSEEYDASFLGAPPGHRQDEIERYVRQAKIAYDALKEVNPQCTVVGLTASSTELFGPAFWEIAKAELAPRSLFEHLDIVGPDAYCSGPYEITKFNIDSCVPEASPLRQALLATGDLQAALGNGRGEIRISEFGYMIPYHYREPDDDVTKRVAGLLARYLVIAKTVPCFSDLSLYAASGSAAYDERHKGLVSTDGAPLWDCGLWRIDYDEEGVPHGSPRPWVAAVASVTRFLQGVSDPEELALGIPSCYGWRFKAGAGTVTVLWTSSKRPIGIAMELPDSVKYDLMGNPETIRAGSHSLELRESPVFIVAMRR